MSDALFAASVHLVLPPDRGSEFLIYGPRDRRELELVLTVLVTRRSRRTI